jgi:Ni/Co efflux regulator RcnB
MIKKLIVVAMLIATFGIGSLAYPQATGGSSGKGRRNAASGEHRHSRRVHRRHRTHRRGYGKKAIPR